MYMTRNLYTIVLLLVSALLLFACASPTSPNEPNDPPEQVESYTYTITYIRPQGSIVRPEKADPTVFVAQNKNGGRPIPNLTKINDYEFTGNVVIPTHLKKESSLPPNYIYVVDARRWVEMWDSGYSLLWGKPHSVGDIFRLKNNTTGAELTLTSIVINTLNSTWPAECEPKMAQFWTIKGGTIHNAWPY